MTATGNEQAIDVFLAGLAEHDAGRIASALTDDAVFLLPRPSHLGRAIRGGARIGAYLAELTGETYVTTEFRYGPRLAGGAHGMAEWNMRAVSAEGGKLDQFFCFAFDFAGGRIAEIRAYIDTAHGQQAVGREAGRVVEAFASA